MKLTKKNRKNKGFTLIELIVVVSIMLILSSFMIPKILGYQDKAKKAKVVNSARQIFDATMSDYAEEEGILTQSKVLALVNSVIDSNIVTSDVVVASATATSAATATVKLVSDTKTYQVIVTPATNGFSVKEGTTAGAEVYANK